MKSLKKLQILMIFIIACAYNSVYSLAFMKSLYYQLMKSGLGLSHFRLGQLYSIYGLLSMFSYLFGAYFLSRFKCWKLVSASLFLIGILTLSLTLLPSYTIIIIIFGAVGFLLGAVFYPAHLQLLHHIGTPYCQSTVFSLFYIFNGVLGVVFAFLGFQLSSISAPNEQLITLLFLLFAVLNISFSILSAIFLRKLPSNPACQAAVNITYLKQLLKNKKLWTVIIIVFTNYIAFSSLNYILLFLDSLYTLPTEWMNILILLRTYLISIFAAPLAGKITDYFHSASRLMKYSFIFNAISLTAMILLQRYSFIAIMICILLSCISIYMGKSMSLITIDEAKIPPFLYGLSISFISFTAYSPDAFYYSISGYLLDLFPVYGYSIIFLIVIIVSIIGFHASKKLEKDNFPS